MIENKRWSMTDLLKMKQNAIARSSSQRQILLYVWALIWFNNVCESAAHNTKIYCNVKMVVYEIMKLNYKSLNSGVSIPQNCSQIWYLSPEVKMQSSTLRKHARRCHHCKIWFLHNDDEKETPQQKQEIAESS